MLLRFLKQQAVFIGILLLFTVFVPISMAQDINICRDTSATVINYDETLIGSLDPNLPVSDFCFDAERGTQVTITLTPVTQNLATALIVGTPFVDNIGMFVDEPLLVVESPMDGSAYSGTVSITSDGTYLISVQGVQNVQGTFRITLELSGGNILGSPVTDDSATPDDNSTPDDGNDTSETDEIVFGETNLCELNVTIPLISGATLTGSASPTDLSIYCFEATENDIITIDFTITADTPAAYIMVDPFYDGTPDSTVYSQVIAQVPDETFTDQLIVEQGGVYALLVFSLAEDTNSDFSLTVSNAQANVYNCENEPLATLSSRQWGINLEDDTTIIEVNIACSDRLSLAALGGSTITQYNVDQEGTFFFIYQNRFYFTTDLSADEWAIEREDGQQYTLQALTDSDACSGEDLQMLIHGSWYWQLDANQGVYFDFTCNGIVLIDDQQNPSIAGNYSYGNGTINILLGEQAIIFTDVEAGEDRITAILDGFAVELENVLFETSGED